MRRRLPGILLVIASLVLLRPADAPAARVMERLGRGVIAVVEDGGKVFVSWRLLNDDGDDVAFNLYCTSGGAQPVRLNDEPIRGATCFADSKTESSRPRTYFVRAVTGGREQDASAPFTLPGDAPPRQYLSIPLQTLPGHTPNDASVADLDGDGEYEIVVKQEMRPRDNSRPGATGETKLEAYKLDGTFLWRINLGRNIREGAHYTPFIVYDLDGDGRAEVACKTADGTTDGKGKVIGDPTANHVNDRGHVLAGPELLTVFEGATGKALATAPYLPPRGDVAAWGDAQGNRANRFLAAVAYLDGERPSLVMCRGYYTRAVLAAWDWRGGRLVPRWTFDSDDGTPGNRAYRGQGNHNLAVGDVDGDGKDEIVYGSCAIDDNGKGLYSTGLGHGDAMHLADIDPSRPGLEVFGIHERPRHPNAAALFDAATGKVLWGLNAPDPVRGVAMDIDPRHPGYECWAQGDDLRGLYNCKGEKLSDARPRSCNFGVWWDGDPLRELLDRNTITKWKWEEGSETVLLEAEACRSSNGSKATPALCADIVGDWREEVVLRTSDSRELRVYTTTISTPHRLRTLMHDPQYRLSVAWQNVGYNQPTQVGGPLRGNAEIRNPKSQPEQK